PDPLERPSDVWLELKAVDGGPVGVRWSEQPGIPAPAFGLDVRHWPMKDGQPARPALSAWWRKFEVPSNRLRRERVMAKSLDGLRGEKLEFGPDAATVDAVTIENHTVEVQPGVPAEKSCLVVRLRHTPGRPVYARLPGWSGHEDRFYTEASKYTGLFWPVKDE